MSAIQHVVVLMFENRSFDHLLGLLSNDPTYPGVKLGDTRFSNPVDPRDPSRGRVPVTDNATADLGVDPPHSHASVVEQMGLRGSRPPTMDGFVAAYSRKIDGKEEGLPIIHWFRIGTVLVGTVAAIAGALVIPVPGLWISAAVILLLVEAAVTWAYRRRRTLPVESWAPVFVTPVVLVSGLSALSIFMRAESWWLRFLVLAVGLLLVLETVAIWRYKKVVAVPEVGGRARQIMRCMSPMTQLPALATLASEFTVCTRWHCSVPGATWPNRNFAHAGTSDGTVDIEVGFYENDTIFQRLTDAHTSWHIYRHPESLSQVMAFEWLLEEEQQPNWRRLDEFRSDVKERRLPAYSFIEPCHDGPESNSQHPGNNDQDRQPDDGALWDFQRGENLLIEVYQALKDNGYLDKTLLVVTYDEHGGFYDHVPPPTDAVAPEPLGTPRRSLLPRLLGWFVEQPESRFQFTTLGPRVPTVVVSARIPKRVRNWDDTCYDHTAIPRTVRKLFAPDAPPLSAREAVSPTFDHLASLDTPRRDLPDLTSYIQQEMGFGGLADATRPHRDDEFARQLERLGQNVYEKLAADAPGFGPLAEAAPSSLDVAQLFTGVVEQARPAGDQ